MIRVARPEPQAMGVAGRDAATATPFAGGSGGVPPEFPDAFK